MEREGPPPSQILGSAPDEERTDHIAAAAVRGSQPFVAR